MGTVRSPEGTSVSSLSPRRQEPHGAAEGPEASRNTDQQMSITEVVGGTGGKLTLRSCDHVTVASDNATPLLWRPGHRSGSTTCSGCWAGSTCHARNNRLNNRKLRPEPRPRAL